MEDFRKMAIEVRRNIEKSVFEDRVPVSKMDEVEYEVIENALRTVAEQHEKIGYNRAVEECAKYCEEWKSSVISTNNNNTDIEVETMCNDVSKNISEAIRRLTIEDKKDEALSEIEKIEKGEL